VFSYTPYVAPIVGAFLCHNTYKATSGSDARVSIVLSILEIATKWPDSLNPPGLKAK
jgi:hypothetical protein